jgi:hypothetical protein
MDIKELFTINVLYELVIIFLDVEAIKLRSVCKIWKNKCIICKSLTLFFHSNMDPLIKKLSSIIYPKYLENIEINGYKIKEMSSINLGTLSQFTNLKEIHLIDIFYISEQSMYFLSDLPKLELLSFTDCYITIDANTYIKNDYNSRCEENVNVDEELNLCEKCDKLIEKYKDKYEDYDEEDIFAILCEECCEEIEKYKHTYIGHSLRTDNCHNINDNNELNILKAFKKRNKIVDIPVTYEKKSNKFYIINIIFILIILFGYFIY